MPQSQIIFLVAICAMFFTFIAVVGGTQIYLALSDLRDQRTARRSPEKTPEPTTRAVINHG